MSNLRTIKIRGDSTENWELANPILEYKEIACEFTDNGTFFKVGNGTDSWNDLAYASIDDGIGEAPADGKLYARKDSAWAEVVIQGNAVTSVSGKTGAVTLAKEDVGLSNVDNTSDINKPISNPTQDALDNKVDKVTGKGLSTNDYSNADKAKLASLEGSHFRGVYVNEAALATIQNPVAGDYADVDAGIEADAERWIYDASDSKWVSQESAASVTAAQVKQLYESNTDTNAFTNVEKTKLSGIASDATKNRDDSENADKVHTHTINQVSGLDDALDDKVDKVTGKGLIEPAPVDGKEYVRKDGTWVEAEGGASALAELTDVDFGTPTDGQVLTYDAATQTSKFADQAGAEALSLSDLSDVASTPTRNNHILKWDDASQMWAKTYETIPTDEPGNGPAYVRAYNSWQPLSNYAIVEAPSDGKLYARSSGTWKEAPSYPTGSIASRPHWLRNGQTEVAELKGLYDVSWGTPSGGDVLTYNANTAKVEFGSGAGIEEAPNDSKPYVRMNNAWVVGVSEPTTTNNTFSLRKTSSGTTWVTALDPSNKKILIGPGASGHNSTFGGIAIGENSQSTKTGTVDVGSIAVGKGAKAYSQGDISIGAAAVTASHSGQGSHSQRDRTSIGTNASAVGIASIALGKEASSPNHYSVALGNGAATESDNEIRLGGVDAIVKTQSAVVVVSDERDKADIQEHNLGLDFINLLTPVKWKSDPREAYAPREEDFETYEEYRLAKESWDPSSVIKDGSRKGQRFKYGLIAQQVKEAMDVLGTDFSGYVDDSVTAGGAGNKALVYSDFISPLILAVQQLSSKVENLEQEVRDLREEGK